jgi:hypothetical protein
MAGFGAFAVGVGAALAAQAFGPALGRRARPLARGVIKEALILTEGARARSAGLREGLADLAAEARAELRQQQAQPSRAGSKRSRVAASRAGGRAT